MYSRTLAAVWTLSCTLILRGRGEEKVGRVGGGITFIRQDIPSRKSGK